MTVIRRATPDDVPAVARVHIATWRSAYKGIVPQEFLDAMDEPDNLARRLSNWNMVTENPNVLFYVAEDEANGIIGFASGGKCRNQQPEFAEYEGEIYALYLLPEYHGQGIGRKLVKTIVQDLQDAGYQKMLIWVLKDNHPSRAFYERIGGQYVHELMFELAGTQLAEVGYGYELKAVR
jgi:ribosomal protein S18 acetylase RimI-like enzyme